MRFLSWLNKGIGLRGFAAVLVVAGLTVSALAQAPAPADAAGDSKKPKIVADEPEKDFGALYAGTSVSHTYKISNVGDADLRITRVASGCSCTLTGKYPEVLKPGESAEIPFTLNTTTLRGPFTRSPVIYSNDPATPELRLTMKGEAKRYIDVQPANILFSALGGSEPMVRTVKITNNIETPMELTMQSPAQSEVFKMELTATQPGKEYELKVTAAPPWGDPGLKRATVVLDTNIEKEKQITIHVNGTLPIRIDVQPSVIRIAKTSAPPPGAVYPPPLPGEQAATMPARKTIRIVRFSNNGQTPIKLTEVSTNDPAIVASYKEYQQGKLYLINLEFPMDYVPSSGGKTLTIKTDDAEKPVIEVPIVGETRPTPPLPPPTPLAPPTTQVARKDPPRQAPTGTVEGLVGKSAPEFKLTTEDGKAISNTDIGAQVAVLDFFSPRCGFCRKQMPVVDAVRKEYEAKGVRFVYVAQKMGTAPTVSDCTQMMEQIKVAGELAMDTENKIGGELFHVRGYPTMVILDKQGKVATVNVGALPDLADRMKKQLDALLEGKPIPADLLPSNPPPNQAKQQMRPSEALVGKDAPEFTMTTEGGKPISNKDIGAQVAVLDFFSPRCGFCRKQMPVVEAVRKEYEAKGVRFVYVAQKMGTAPTVSDCTQMMEQMNVSGELAMDAENKIGGQLFHVTGYPTMVILDKQGKVAAVNVGAIPDLADRTKKQLDALLEGKPIPENLLPRKDAAPAPSQAQQMRPAETLVGKDIPEFKLETESGKPISHDNLGAAVAVLDFFAPKCGFCRRQMPVVDKIRKDYEAKGVRFLYVGQAMGAEPTKQDCTQMMEQIGVTGDLAMDAQNKVGSQVFKTTGYPTMVILDKGGKVAAVNVGARPDLAERVPKQLDALLAGKPIPADLLPAIPSPTAKQ